LATASSILRHEVWARSLSVRVANIGILASVPADMAMRVSPARSQRGEISSRGRFAQGQRFATRSRTGVSTSGGALRI
jgi:hypothetical protein